MAIPVRPASRARATHASTSARPTPRPLAAGATPSIRKPASPRHLQLREAARVVGNVGHAAQDRAVRVHGHQDPALAGATARVADVVEIGDRARVPAGEPAASSRRRTTTSPACVELLGARLADLERPVTSPTSSASRASGSWTGWRQAKSRQTNAVGRPWSANRWRRSETADAAGVRGDREHPERGVARGGDAHAAPRSRGSVGVADDRDLGDPGVGELERRTATGRTPSGSERGTAPTVASARSAAARYRGSPVSAARRSSTVAAMAPPGRDGVVLQVAAAGRRAPRRRRRCRRSRRPGRRTGRG